MNEIDARIYQIKNTQFPQVSSNQNINNPNKKIAQNPAKNRPNEKIIKYGIIATITVLGGILLFKGKTIFNKITNFLKKESQKTPSDEILPPHTPPKPPIHTPSPAPISSKYSLIDEYEKFSKEYLDFVNNSSELNTAEAEKLRLKFNERQKNYNKRLINEHQSIVRVKHANEFNSAEERNDYLKNALYKMNKTEETAIDVLEMFDEYGQRMQLSEIANTSNILAEGIYTLPKECKTDNILNKFIDVYSKYAVKESGSYYDQVELGNVLVDFLTESPQEIKPETYAKGIKLLSRIADETWDYERIATSLENYKHNNHPEIIASIEELKKAVDGKPKRVTYEHWTKPNIENK